MGVVQSTQHTPGRCTRARMPDPPPMTPEMHTCMHVAGCVVAPTPPFVQASTQTGRIHCFTCMHACLHACNACTHACMHATWEQPGGEPVVCRCAHHRLSRGRHGLLLGAARHNCAASYALAFCRSPAPAQQVHLHPQPQGRKHHRHGPVRQVPLRKSNEGAVHGGAPQGAEGLGRGLSCAWV